MPSLALFRSVQAPFASVGSTSTGAVDRDDDVDGRRRARAAGVRVRGHVEMVDAEELGEPGVRLAGARRRSSWFGLTAALQPVAMTAVVRARRRVGEGEAVEVRRACSRPRTRSPSRSPSRHSGDPARPRALRRRSRSAAGAWRSRRSRRRSRTRRCRAARRARASPPAGSGRALPVPFASRLLSDPVGRAARGTRPCSQVRSGIGGRHHPIGGSDPRSGSLVALTGPRMASVRPGSRPERVVPERPPPSRRLRRESDERVLGGGRVGVVGRIGEHARDLGGRQTARVGARAASSTRAPGAGRPAARGS